MDDNKTIKDLLTEAYPELSNSQLMKLTEAYFTVNWMNQTITIERFIILLSNDYNSINV